MCSLFSLHDCMVDVTTDVKIALIPGQDDGVGFTRQDGCRARTPIYNVPGDGVRN